MEDNVNFVSTGEVYHAFIVLSADAVLFKLQNFV